MVALVGHQALISFPVYKAALPWYARFIDPVIVLDAIVFAGCTVVTALLRPWALDPVGSAITVCVFAALLGPALLVIRLLSRAPARTPARYVRLMEWLTRRTLSRSPGKFRFGPESVAIEAADLIISSNNGTALVPLNTIERVDLTPAGVYLVRGPQIVAGLPHRAFRDPNQLNEFLKLLGPPVQQFPT